MFPQHSYRDEVFCQFAKAVFIFSPAVSYTHLDVYKRQGFISVGSHLLSSCVGSYCRIRCSVYIIIVNSYLWTVSIYLSNKISALEPLCPLMRECVCGSVKCIWVRHKQPITKYTTVSFRKLPRSILLTCCTSMEICSSLRSPILMHWEYQ